ncbi:hypothetical protein GPECTOR_60g756 [Gonium pectorale]|uniref:Uncharacterized protein n=1 Tax=Gonium pectorale TaxID=33097 RepID=A0A150G580_GONPE|nr:hypothetical protein GPECTOR_60g756 [Gonium pectorale]|eukprot:KXZ44978.1 hypothetical protein GPECTOR_60g756 [Gonium pectorale]
MPADSLLYSLKTGNGSRGSTPTTVTPTVASPPPIASPRRLRAQSVTGDASRKSDLHDQHQHHQHHQHQHPSLGGGGGLVGLPKLDIPPGGFGILGDAPLSVRGSPSAAGRRGSISGGGSALCEASISASFDSALTGRSSGGEAAYDCDAADASARGGGSLGSAGSSAECSLAGHTAASASELLAGVNDDLQRAAGALLALHAPACRPRSAAPNAPPPPPPPVTAAQLTALRSSAPELHSELRVAVRRAFQVMRQAVAGGGGSAAAPTLSGRQLGSSVHECWATLDAFLEGTAELTMSLVEGALAARGSGGGASPSGLGRSKSRGGTRDGAAPEAEVEVVEEEADGAEGSGPGPVSGARRGGAGGTGGNSKMFKLHDAVQELEELKILNDDLQRQLEESRARVAALEARAAEGDRGGGGGAAVSPRPPQPHATPPPDGAYGSSPRVAEPHAFV